MKIARVEATPLSVRYKVDALGLDIESSNNMVFVEVETDDGL